MHFGIKTVDFGTNGFSLKLLSYGESVFDIQDDYINVVIPFNTEVMDNHRNVSSESESNDAISEKEQKIVLAILENPKVTFDGLSSVTGIPKRTLSRLIGSLQERGYIGRIGTRRDGRWIVLK